MTDLVTPAELIQDMLELSQKLDGDHDDLIKACREYSEKEDIYRLAKANAYLAATGTVDQRKAYVDKTTSHERRDAHTAENLMKAGFARVKSTQIQISIRQSAAQMVKSEMQMAGRFD